LEVFAGALQLWRLWRAQAQARHFVAQLGDRELRDAGLTRGDIWREQCRPFWRTGFLALAVGRPEPPPCAARKAAGAMTKDLW
jgi:uncharacterized protein YjiS (DUF1127 family)